ncbi:MAG: hypothetical protein KC583_15550, partial [Myxococcales bacterium]|nr:hypothetical protein [Myxococcales bacterium]
MSSVLRLALVLLTLGASKPHTTVEAAPAGGAPLTVRWDEGAAVLRQWTAAESSGREELWSAVGPMTAVRERVESMGENRMYATDHLTVRQTRGGAFDLDAWLEASDQLRALPPASAAALVASRKSGARAFSVDDWWPARSAVALSVESEGCEIVPAVCTLRTLRILVRPPETWRPWLDAALAGRGVLRDHLAGRVAGLSEPAQARLFGAVLAGQAGELTVLVGRRVGRPRVVVTGFDDQPRVELCVRVERLLQDPWKGLDLPGRRSCFHTTVPTGFDATAAAKTLRWLGPPGA